MNAKHKLKYFTQNCRCYGCKQNGCHNDEICKPNLHQAVTKILSKFGIGHSSKKNCNFGHAFNNRGIIVVSAMVARSTIIVRAPSIRLAFLRIDGICA